MWKSLILQVCILYYIQSGLGLTNNACKHFYDYPTKNVNPDCYYNPDVDSTTPQIIRNHGFEVESHFATTPDGYILQLFRIPPKANDFRRQKQPLFFEHGILVDSSSFVFVGNRSLALSLAAEGYDIWLGNYRGTIYSLGHTFLKNSDAEYWNFPVDVSGLNDVSASLQKVADVTGKAGSIVYIGFSRGSAFGFIYGIVYKESCLLRGVIALAPIGSLDAKIQIRLVFSLAPVLAEILPRLGIWSLFQNTRFIRVAQSMCSSLPYVCVFLLTLGSGPSKQLLADDLYHLVSRFPSAYSLMEIVHANQLIEIGRLQKFDYGLQKNLEIYGQEKPPVYDLRNMTVPAYLFYGRNDAFLSEEAVMKQFNDLGSSEKGLFKIPIDIDDEELQWGHVDFIMAKDTSKLLYEPLRKVLEEKLRPLNSQHLKSLPMEEGY